jgi:predicted transposase/invertase (TIGR01784 family)
LAIFSNNVAQVQAAYQTLQGEPTLFGEVSLYWQRIVTRLDEEIKNMYTKEDFLRDYLPTTESPVLFSWQVEELLKQKTAKNLQEVFEQGIEQGITQKTHDIVLAMHAKGFDLAVIADITGLTVAQVQTLLQAEATKARDA